MKRGMVRRMTSRSALEALALVALLSSGAALSAEPEISAKRQGELLYILEQDCGSCHGLTLKGGLGPALLPERFDGRTAADVAQVILDGTPGTPMPPWRPIINEEEALWLAGVLKSGEMVK